MLDSKNGNSLHAIKILRTFSFALLLGTVYCVFAQDYETPGVRDIDNVLPERERAKLWNRCLEWRLKNILPDVMKRAGIDL